jgi:hypothetical protein
MRREPLHPEFDVVGEAVPSEPGRRHKVCPETLAPRLKRSSVWAESSYCNSVGGVRIGHSEDSEALSVTAIGFGKWSSMEDLGLAER